MSAMETEAAAEKDKGHCHGVLMRATPIPPATTSWLTGVRILVRTIE